MPRKMMILFVTFCLIPFLGFAVTDFEKDLELAETGNPGAEFRTGARYLNGDGVAKDYSKALFWLKKAAAKNHANALYNLGYMHLYGVGVVTDMPKAADYFIKSSKGGFLPAYHLLCVMYYDGAGVKKDMKAAYNNCKTAADGGYKPAGRIMDNVTKTIKP